VRTGLDSSVAVEVNRQVARPPAMMLLDRGFMERVTRRPELLWSWRATNGRCRLKSHGQWAPTWRLANRPDS
jgi:hypothetical protein